MLNIYLKAVYAFLIWSAGHSDRGSVEYFFYPLRGAEKERK
jgi:hypothetical protein